MPQEKYFCICAMDMWKIHISFLSKNNHAGFKTKYLKVVVKSEYGSSTGVDVFLTLTENLQKQVPGKPVLTISKFQCYCERY